MIVTCISQAAHSVYVLIDSTRDAWRREIHCFSESLKRLFSVKMHFELMLHVFLDAYFRSYFTDPDATAALPIKHGISKK